MLLLVLSEVHRTSHFGPRALAPRKVRRSVGKERFRDGLVISVCLCGVCSEGGHRGVLGQLPYN